MRFTIDTFNLQWIAEAERAQRILSLISDATLSAEDRKGGKPIGDAAWALVINPIKTLGMSGFHIAGPPSDQPFPLSIKKLREDHATVVRSVRQQVSKQWGKESLEEIDSKSRFAWPREFILIHLITDQVALRYDLMNLLKKSGVSLPFLFAPPTAL